MPCYRVSFFKHLVNSDGHPFRCIQQVIEVRQARSPDRAVKAAELRYERLHRVHDWTLHSDCLELEIDGRKVEYCPIGLVAGKLPAIHKAAQAKAVAKRLGKSRRVKLGATVPTD